jgi:hypothetical protein
MHIDMEKLEAERFGLQPDQARAMLTTRGTVRQRAPKGQGKKPVVTVKAETPAEPKAQVKRRRTVLHLTEAQERAFTNYVEGMK